MHFAIHTNSYFRNTHTQQYVFVFANIH